MRKSRFSEEQIIGVLKEAETTTVKIACAKNKISEATYYVWKRKFGRLAVDEARRLRALENENARLKHIIAGPGGADPDTERSKRKTVMNQPAVIHRNEFFAS
jgi:putative transposase